MQLRRCGTGTEYSQELGENSVINDEKIKTKYDTIRYDTTPVRQFQMTAPDNGDINLKLNWARGCLRHLFMLLLFFLLFLCCWWCCCCHCSCCCCCCCYKLLFLDKCCAISDVYRRPPFDCLRQAQRVGNSHCLPRTPSHPLQGNEVFLPGNLSFISDLWGVASSYKLNACLIAL